jgi:hypothetical protein
VNIACDAVQKVAKRMAMLKVEVMQRVAGVPLQHAVDQMKEMQAAHRVG